LVARLQTVAEPNSLVISPVTHRLVGTLFDYRDLGRHTLKGFPNPEHVRQVLGPSKVENRFEALQAMRHSLGARKRSTCYGVGGSRPKVAKVERCSYAAKRALANLGL
jgi:hypothetical protein